MKSDKTQTRKPQTTTNKSFKNKKKRFNKKFKTKQVKIQRRAAAKKQYNCTLCGAQAKKDPCATPKPTKDDPEAKTGLGKWRCPTHGKCKVTVAAITPEVKAA